MNSTLDNYGASTNISFGKVAIDNAAYSIGFSFIVLVLLIIISFISYKCNRSRSSSSAAAAAANTINSSDHSNADSIVIYSRGGSGSGSGGLDEATLGHHPKFLYSQAKPLIRGDLVASGCSICLGDYKDTDMLRLLPECGHLFHLKCIDPWLKLHPTCPICRRSPLPTPLAQVLPLHIHPN